MQTNRLNPLICSQAAVWQSWPAIEPNCESSYTSFLRLLHGQTLYWCPDSSYVTLSYTYTIVWRGVRKAVNLKFFFHIVYLNVCLCCIWTCVERRRHCASDGSVIASVVLDTDVLKLTVPTSRLQQQRALRDIEQASWRGEPYRCRVLFIWK